MKKVLNLVAKYERVILLLIIVVAAVTKLWHLSYPNVYMFDEIYHVPTVHHLLLNDGWAFEWWHGELENELQSGCWIDWLHPPVAKYLSALSVLIFGDNSFAWRLPVALSGVAVTFSTWQLAKILFPKSKTLPLLSALLVTMEGLIYAQSRIMMNDMVVLMWQLAAIIFYLQWQKKDKWRWLILTALFTGLACATKWSGIYLLLIFGCHQFYLVCLDKKHWWQYLLKSTGNLLIILVSAAAIYLVAYLPLFTTGHNWSHFAELHRQIWLYQMNLEATHEYSAPAYLWPLGLKPVYLYYDEITGRQLFNTPTYAIFYLGLLGLFLSIILLIKNPCLPAGRVGRDSQDSKSLGLMLLIFLCVWCPWLFSPRIMFLHHFLPAVPLLCIWASYLLVWMLKHCWSKTK